MSNPLAPPPPARPDLPTEPPPGWAEDPVDAELARLGGTPILTPVLVAASTILFVVMAIAGVNVIDPQARDLQAWGANYGPLTLGGEWWRLATCTFIHIGILHLFMNMVVLWSVGGLLERLVGRAGFLAAYAVSGLAGSMASSWWSPSVTSAGASGAVFGVLGCIVGLLARDRRSVPAAARSRIVRMAAVFIGYNLLFGLSVPGIDMAAHIGGLLAGFGCGIVLALPLEHASTDKRLGRAGLTVGLGAAALVVAALSFGEAPMAASPNQKVSFGKSEVFYAAGATEGDAQSVGAFLKDIGYIAPNRQTAIVLARDGEVLVVGLVVVAGAENNAEAVAAFEQLGAYLSFHAAGGRPVQVRMLDEHLRPTKTFDAIAQPVQPPQ